MHLNLVDAATSSSVADWGDFDWLVVLHLSQVFLFRPLKVSLGILLSEFLGLPDFFDCVSRLTNLSLCCNLCLSLCHSFSLFFFKLLGEIGFNLGCLNLGFCLYFCFSLGNLQLRLSLDLFPDICLDLACLNLGFLLNLCPSLGNLQLRFGLDLLPDLGSDLAF